MKNDNKRARLRCVTTAKRCREIGNLDRAKRYLAIWINL